MKKPTPKIHDKNNAEHKKFRCVCCNLPCKTCFPRKITAFALVDGREKFILSGAGNDNKTYNEIYNPNTNKSA